MKKLLYFLTPIFFVFCSCEPDKVQQGEVEYAITYPNSEISGFMQAILPETMTITFQGTKMKTTIARGEIFTTEIISDETTKSVEMRLDFGDKLFYSVLDENEVQEMISSQPDYVLTALNKNDSIAGMYASSYKVDCAKDSIDKSNAWFTSDLAPINAYWFTSYNEAVGFPLIYDIERYGVMMHLEAINIDKREVTEDEFERDPSLVEVSFEDYEAEVQELFDILME